MKALQDQHEDQQSEIDYLKAEIEELKRQISTQPLQPPQPSKYLTTTIYGQVVAWAPAWGRYLESFFLSFFLKIIGGRTRSRGRKKKPAFALILKIIKQQYRSKRPRIIFSNCVISTPEFICHLQTEVISRWGSIAVQQLIVSFRWRRRIAFPVQ